jgi:hypothetical protein
MWPGLAAERDEDTPQEDNDGTALVLNFGAPSLNKRLVQIFFQDGQLFLARRLVQVCIKSCSS